MKKLRLFTYFSLMLSFASLKAQTLNVNDAVSPTDLIANLITSNCDTGSNIVMNNDGSGQSINSYGSFTASNNPSFNLTEGMVLTTGTAVNAGTSGALNINGDITNWSGSTFYENALGLTSGTTFNATEIEFSFTALKNNVTIDYVFASEEYVLNTLCSRNEGVVILIKESTAPDTMYTNIALVPGTNDPVTVANIHAERAGVCSAVNESFLGGARGSTTPFPNYSQYTTTLQAQTNSVMGTDYIVKIIIADEEDGNYDSAVFVGPIDNEQETPISATYISNGLPVTINNGTISECGQGVVLQLDAAYPSSYTYEWFNGTSLISGENGTSLSVNTSGDYTARVYESPSCFSEVTITANLSTNQVGNDLSDLSECVSSGSSATFVLTDNNANALAGRNATAVDYSSNATGPITASQASSYNGTDGEIITAVVTEPSGCIYTSTFTLNIEINGSFLNAAGYDLVLCDSPDPTFNDGFTAVYPSDIEPLLPVLTSGSYTYYDNNNNIVTGSGVGTFTSNTNGYLPFRIEYNSDSGCTSSAELRITVNQPPSLTAGSITYIEVCDDGTDGAAQDGFAAFDMTPKRDEIQAELDAASSTATITFYSSLQAANGGVASNEIVNIANYINDPLETSEYVQLVGIRIESANGCFATQQLELRPRYLITNVNFQDERICDIGADGFEAFDLSGKKAEIIGTNNYTASIFRSFEDAEMNTNEISDAELASFTNETINTQRLWVRIEDLDTGCVDYDEDAGVINLFVDTKPTINTPTTTLLTPICDPGTDGQVDGLVDYFNSEIASEINTDSSIALSYFDYQPDPNTVDPTTAIDNLYLNAASSTPITYWAMGANPSFGCFSDPVSFQLQVNPAPLVDNATPNTIYFCYDASDADPQIAVDVNNLDVIADQSDITISYFTTEDGARNNDSVTLIDLSAGFFTNSDTSIWYRIENNNTGCFSIVEQPIIVNTIPVLQVLQDFILCVDPGNTQAGFLLSSQDSTILNGQTGKTVRYFSSATLAESGNLADEIDKNTPFDATDGTEIFVRVENISDPDCYNENNIQSFVLNVAEYSTTGNATPQLTDCGLFGVAEFDLQRIINDITQNGTVALRSIDFYEDPADAGYVAVLPNNVAPPAANTANAISDTDNNPNTLLFTNSTPLSQQIYVRIENNSGCVTFQTFDLIVSETPIVGTIPSLVACDTNGDLTENVDLTQIENLSTLDFSQMVRPILDINDIDFTYFTTEAGRDAYVLNNSTTNDLITDPANFVVNQTGDTPIYLVIEANTSCVYASEFSVQLDPLPAITPQVVFACEDALGSNQFVIDLDTLNDNFNFYTDGDTDVRLDYFSDALGTSPINGQFTKTASISAIYLQAVNTRTSCVSDQIIEIPLTAKALPLITTPSTTEAVTCDNDDVNDGITVFDLSTLNSIVLNGQDPNVFTVTYFNSASAEMFSDSEVTNGETYTAVITNTDTDCENSVDFLFTVNQLPEIEPLSIVEFCDDDEVTTNTSILDLTEVFASLNYTTSVQAATADIRFFNDPLMLNEITTPTSYNKVGDEDEVIYLDLRSANDCYYQTSFTIQVNPMPIINAEASVPLVFCEDTFGSGQYTMDLDIDVATQVVDNPNNYTITYHSDINTTAANEINSPFVTGSTTIYVRVVSALNCENVAPVAIEISPIPSVNPITSSTDICDEDGVNDGVVIYDFNVYRAEILGSQSETEFEVTYHQSMLDAENDVPFNLDEISTGTYYVKVQNRASLCYNIAPIAMTINRLPEIDDEEIFFCANNPARSFDKSTGNSSDTYLWEFSSGRASENTSSVSLSFADVGTTATLTITNGISNCSNSNEFIIAASPTPEIVPVVTKYFESDEAVIEVTEPGDYLYALTKTAIIPDASEAQESNVFTDLLPGRYYAHVIDLNGCGDIEPMEVNFVDYYPYFSPDGSGPEETETWHIQAIEEIPETVVYIYSRYGVLMSTLYNGSPGWDGFYNGKPMPSDDYWILIELPDGETIKDHITLIRQ